MTEPPARMPDRWMHHRPISTLLQGQSVWIDADSVRVDRRQQAWLRLHDRIPPTYGKRSVLLHYTEDGYVIEIPKEFEWHWYVLSDQDLQKAALAPIARIDDQNQETISDILGRLYKISTTDAPGAS